MAVRNPGVILLIALALGTSFGPQALAQQPTAAGELSRTLETSNLSPESKALLRAKADELVRTGIAERDVAGLIRQSAVRGVQAPDLARLLDVVAEARRQDLPAAAVVDKIKEGLAKRIPPERIASVASRIASELMTSRDLIRRAEREGIRVEVPGERERAVGAVADALGRGVPPKEVEELARHVAHSSPHQATMSRLESGAQVAADLISMGLSPRAAAETVAAALARGSTPRDIERLREQLARELRRGESPEEGAKRLREQIRSERPANRADPGPDREWRGREGMGRIERPERPEKPGR